MARQRAQEPRTGHGAQQPHTVYHIRTCMFWLFCTHSKKDTTTDPPLA